MASISELSERRKALVTQHEAILSKAEAEDRALTAEETAADDKLIGDIKALDDRTARHVMTGDIRERGKESTGRPKLDPLTQDHDKPHTGATRVRVTDPMLRYSGGGFAPYKDRESAKRVGLFLIATCGQEGARDHARELCRSEGIEYQAVMSSTSPTGGGGFIFDEFSTAVIDMAEEYGVFRREAKRWPMNSDTLVIPRITGGLTAYFLSEGVAGTASDPTSDLVTLTAQALGTLTYIPRELMEDSAINLAALVTKEAALALATKEDLCGFLGDGTATYGGIVGLVTKLNDAANAASVVTAVSGNITFDTLDLGDFLSVIGKFPMYAGANPKWYMSKAGWAASMQRLALAQGGATSEVVAAGLGAQFLGYSVVFTPNGVLHNTLTSSVSTIHALFGDLSMSSAFGDRRAVSMESSNEYAFTQRLVTMMCWERFAINNHTIVDPRDANKAGPIIALKTPGS